LALKMLWDQGTFSELAIMSKATWSAFAGWPIRTFKRFSADRCAPMAASIAFYSAFSLAPTLVMVIAIAGLVFGEEAARGQLFGQISSMLGKDAATSVQAIVEHAHRSGGGGVAAIVSFALLAIGASATFSSLNTALSVIWPAEKKPKSGVTTLVKVRLISFGLVMGVAFLLIVSLMLDTAVQAAGKWIFGDSPLVIVGDVVQFVLGLVILSCAFGALLKYLPDGEVHWGDALVGGSIAAVLFSIGKKLFAIYLTHAGTANAFGAAGSLAVLLMWLYFAGAVLLLGAEASASRREARNGDRAPVGGNPDADVKPMHTPASGGGALGSTTTAQVKAIGSLPNLHATNKALSSPSRSPSRTALSTSPPFLAVMRVNRWRMVAAAAGAAIFVVARGSGHSRKQHMKSRSEI
jgi:membrane protein